MKKHIMGENGISYTLGEDGLYYPDLYLPEETEYPIGKYGMLRKSYLQEHRKYRSVQEFLKDFKASQIEYSQYRTAIEKWKKETGKEPVAHGIRAKLAEKKREIQNEQENKQHTRSQNKDRGAR